MARRRKTIFEIGRATLIEFKDDFENETLDWLFLPYGIDPSTAMGLEISSADLLDQGLAARYKDYTLVICGIPSQPDDKLPFTRGFFIDEGTRYDIWLTRAYYSDHKAFAESRWNPETQDWEIDIFDLEFVDAAKRVDVAIKLAKVLPLIGEPQHLKVGSGGRPQEFNPPFDKFIEVAMFLYADAKKNGYTLTKCDFAVHYGVDEKTIYNYLKGHGLSMKDVQDKADEKNLSLHSTQMQ